MQSVLCLDRVWVHDWQVLQFRTQLATIANYGLVLNNPHNHAAPQHAPRLSSFLKVSHNTVLELPVVSLPRP